MAESIQDLRIAIIGAGMGGLATALALAKSGFTSIHVFEYAHDLGFVGAGIHLAPNMARILDRLGVWEEIKREAVEAKKTVVRVGSTNSELADVSFDYIKPTYGYPHMVGHRSTLANALFNGCKKEPAIAFHFSSGVENINSFGPIPSFTVLPRDSGLPAYRVEADILLGADGVKSKTRVAMLTALGIKAGIQDTNQAAYRITLHKEQIKDDPELLELINGNQVTRWIGEKRQIIAYPISNHSIYNIATTQPDTNFASATDATYTTRGSKSAMLNTFNDFCPLVQRMLNYAPDGEICEWKLRVHDPIPTWIHHCIALLGDACHPTLPHLAQGASQAIEDAAVIAVVLSQLPDAQPDSISRALRVYEQVRKRRADTLTEMAAASGRTMYLGEGAAKDVRDRQFAALKGNTRGPVPDRYADADVQRGIYGMDCMRVADEEFDRLYNETPENYMICRIDAKL